MEQIQKKFTNSLQKVSDVPGRATWWIYDQAIRAHRKHINTLSIAIFKRFSEENSYFMRSIFTKKYVMYNLITLNLLNLSKVNTKRSCLYSFSFRASHLWNKPPDHAK